MLSGIELLKRQRYELNNSNGAAEKFRDQLLATWAGAKEVRGSGGQRGDESGRSPPALRGGTGMRPSRAL